MLRRLFFLPCTGPRERVLLHARGAHGALSRRAVPRFASALVLGAFLLVDLSAFDPIPAAHAGPSPMQFAGDFAWHATGRFPQQLVTADFNGDGILDFATADSLDGGASILLGEPGGAFRPRLGVGTGAGPCALAACDLDGDGLADLVVANRGAGTLTVLRGRRDGSFAHVRDIAVGPNPTHVVAHDFTGDRAPDLAVITGENGGTAHVLRGRGGGAFDAPVALRSEGGATALSVVELYRNGRHALVVASARGGVSVHVAAAGDHFQPAARYALPGAATAMVGLDLERDGRDDLVVAVAADPVGDSTTTGKLVLLRGKGNGDFAQTTVMSLGFVPTSLAAADLDLDGHPDLVVGDHAHGRLAVLRGDRAGGFQPAGAYRVGGGAKSPVIDDWTCDGRPDVAAVDPFGLGVVVLPGNGDATFGGAASVSAEFGPSSIGSFDVNADGALDLVLTDPFADRLCVLRGDGHGGYEPQAPSNTYAVAPGPRVVLGARLRAGGPLDLVVAHGVHDGFLSLGRNRGDGTFTFAPGDTAHTGGNPVALALADLDGDGALDAVVANAGTNTIAVLRGDGAGRLHVGSVFPSGGSGPVAVALGDVDGDGRLDLVVAHDASHTIALFHGLGTGAFRLAQTILTGPRPRAVALAPLDADGHPDLVVCAEDFYPARGLVAVYPGDGAGRFLAFDPARTARVGFGPAAVAVADFDRDGVPDVAVANEGSSTVALLPGRRAGGFGFGAPLTLGVRAGAGALAADDVDADGRTDLLVGGPAAPGVSVLRNRAGDPPSALVVPALDIEPGECPNRLNVDEGGFLRVALLGGGTLPGLGAFDPTGVAPDSVSLEGVPALRVLPAGSDVSGAAAACGLPCECGGRGPDGFADAVFLFDARAITAALEPLENGETRVLRFEARLADGRVLDAEDCLVFLAQRASKLAEPGAPPAPIAPRPGILGPNPLVRGAPTAFAYVVPAGGAQVRIGVYTVAGRRIALLAHGLVPSGGLHAVAWDGRDDAGRRAPPGVYFLRADVAGARTLARLVIVP